MKRITETLWADYEKVSGQIGTCTEKDEGYKLLLEERDKLRNELLKLEQTSIEADLKKHQMENEVKYLITLRKDNECLEFEYTTQVQK
jgi:hypothetical protein